MTFAPISTIIIAVAIKVGMPADAIAGRIRYNRQTLTVPRRAVALVADRSRISAGAISEALNVSVPAVQNYLSPMPDGSSSKIAESDSIAEIVASEIASTGHEVRGLARPREQSATSNKPASGPTAAYVPLHLRDPGKRALVKQHEHRW